MPRRRPGKPPVRRTDLTFRALLTAIARVVRETREAIGWSQAELAARARISRSMVARVETGSANVSLVVAASLLDALGVRVRLDFDVPFLVDRRRQREPAHARCIAYARRRLERAGWLVAQEVEVVHGRSHGWIDLLAFEPVSRTLAVKEIKTELPDLGAVERTLAWYEREAWAAARRLGWHPRLVVSGLLVLATEANDERILANRAALAASFPVRAPLLADRLADPRGSWSARGRSLAMIDPLSRRAAWLQRTRADGRRTVAHYADYADFMRKSRSKAGRQ